MRLLTALAIDVFLSSKTLSLLDWISRRTGGGSNTNDPPNGSFASFVMAVKALIALAAACGL
jgi:hypothetical protein